MTSQPQPYQGPATPVIVEDLFLTESFLIKGRLAHKHQRLTKVLEDTERTFLTIEDATMISLRGKEVIQTPSVMVNREEVIFAHELVDIASDSRMRQLAEQQPRTKIRAFYSGAVQLELSGMVSPRSYEPTQGAGRWYFIMQDVRLRGLDVAGNEHLQSLRSLSYAIVRKSKIAYVYDFS